MSDPQDPLHLPHGVIDAEPDGAWKSAEAADAEVETKPTASGLPPNAPDEGDATADAPNTRTAPAGPVEGDGAGRGADPDLLGDADLEQGRGDDPDLDPTERRRQEGM